MPPDSFSFDHKAHILKSTILIIAFLGIAFITFTILKGIKKDVWEKTSGGPYTETILKDGTACEHLKRKKESIRWDRIIKIRLVTTDEGPFQPDMWYLFLNSRPDYCNSERTIFDTNIKSIQGHNSQNIG